MDKTFDMRRYMDYTYENSVYGNFVARSSNCFKFQLSDKIQEVLNVLEYGICISTWFYITVDRLND